MALTLTGSLLVLYNLFLNAYILRGFYEVRITYKTLSLQLHEKSNFMSSFLLCNKKTVK